MAGENIDTFFSWKIMDDEATTRIEYYDQTGEMVTPVPLYIPDPEELKMLDKQSRAKSHNVMQTFMRMAGAVYTMAGLGTIEDSKLFREKFEGGHFPMDGHDGKMIDFRRDDDQDSLAEEAELALLRGASGSKKAEFEADQGLGKDTDLDLELEPSFDSTFYSDDLADGQSQRNDGQIDILLKESETLWMLILTGTCAEIEGDEQLQRKKSPSKDAATDQSNEKKETEKKERSDSVTQTDEETKEKDEEQQTTEEKDTEVEAKESVKEDEEQKDTEKVKEDSVKKEEADETLEFISHKYDQNARWSQTIDFPRKKKGTQTDMIATSDTGSQVVSKDLLFR